MLQRKKNHCFFFTPKNKVPPPPPPPSPKWAKLFNLLIEIVAGKNWRKSDGRSGCSLPQAATGCYRLSQAVTGCYRLSQAVTDCCKLLQAATACGRLPVGGGRGGISFRLRVDCAFLATRVRVDFVSTVPFCSPEFVSTSCRLCLFGHRVDFVSTSCRLCLFGHLGNGLAPSKRQGGRLCLGPSQTAKWQGRT